MKNWKTTSAGVVAIVTGVVTIAFNIKSMTPEAITGAATSILTGIGLLFAKDFNVSGTKK